MIPQTPCRHGRQLSSYTLPASPQEHNPTTPIHYMSPHTCPWRFPSFYSTSPYESSDFPPSATIYHTLQTTCTAIPLAGLGIYLPGFPDALDSQDDLSSLRTFSSLGSLFTHRRRLSRTQSIYGLDAEQSQPLNQYLYSSSEAFVKSESQSPCDLKSVLRSEFLSGNTTPQVGHSSPLVTDSSAAKTAALMEENAYQKAAEDWTSEQILSACKVPFDVLSAHISNDIQPNEGFGRPTSDGSSFSSLEENASSSSTAGVKDKAKTPEMKLPVADLDIRHLKLSQLLPSAGIDPAQLTASLHKYAISQKMPIRTHLETTPPTPATYFPAPSPVAPCSPGARSSPTINVHPADAVGSTYFSQPVGALYSPAISVYTADALGSPDDSRSVSAPCFPGSPRSSVVSTPSNSPMRPHASVPNSSLPPAKPAPTAPMGHCFPPFPPPDALIDRDISVGENKPSVPRITLKVPAKRKHEVLYHDRQLCRPVRSVRVNYNEETNDTDSNASSYCPSGQSSPALSSHQGEEDTKSYKCEEMDLDLHELDTPCIKELEDSDQLSPILGTPILDAHQGISIIDLRARAQRYRLRNLGRDYDKRWLISFAGKLTPKGEHMRDYRCYVTGCGQKNKRRDHILIHVGGHLDQRLFKCSHCSSRFLRKNECKRHELSHSGIRPHACDCCPLTFVRKDLLRRHLLRVHSTSLPSTIKENLSKPRPRLLKRSRLQ